MRVRFGIVFCLTVLSAALLGGLLGERVSAGGEFDAKSREEFLKVFAQTLATIQENYGREVSSQLLVESAIRGMLQTLDPHSSYFATTDYNRLQEEHTGKYYGLGILIRPVRPGSGRIVIVEPPAPGTPAHKVGLQAGDVISRIEGEPIDEWEYPDEIVPRLKGPKGTTVNITIERPGEPKPIDLTVERDEIPIYTIKYVFFLRPRIGYIGIDRFSETTGRELAKALQSLDEENLQGLILDLRDNPGGSLSQAIAVADRFLEKGQLIVSTKGRNGKGQEYRAPHGSRYKYPMVVLINRNSASASEIVAGALQDHDRALIVGETSFGKALVQTIYPLPGQRGLALTTGKYYTPSNRLIQRDYSDSFYDYYVSRSGSSDSSDVHYTDGGREVRDRGGIAPDVEVPLRQASRLGSQILRANLFYEFASKLLQGEILSDVRYHYSAEERAQMSEADKERIQEELTITDRTLALFKDFLRDKQLRFTDESFEENRELIRNRLKRELFLVLLGDREGYRVALEIDDQVQRAIELLPKAAALLHAKGNKAGD